MDESSLETVTHHVFAFHVHVYKWNTFKKNLISIYLELDQT